MAFKINHKTDNSEVSQKKLSAERLYIIVGLELETQFEYENNTRTDTVTGYQVWVSTTTHNPFRVKFLPEDKPDLTYFTLGDEVTFDHLEAIQIKLMFISVQRLSKRLKKGEI